jgi:phosphate transport system permease protein
MGSYRGALRAYLKSGTPFVWVTGGALVLSLLMVAGLLYLIASKTLGFFWTPEMVALSLEDGSRLLGEVTAREEIPAPAGKEGGYRVQLKIGNRDLYGLDFRWVDEDKIKEREYPGNAVLIERREWGNFYGFLREVREGDTVIARGDKEAWEALNSLLPGARELYGRIKDIETKDIGEINYALEKHRLDIRSIELKEGRDAPGAREAVSDIEAEIKKLEDRYKALESELSELKGRLRKNSALFESIDGNTKELYVGGIVRAYRPNTMGAGAKAALYVSKVWEFVSDNPRESNTEGGVFPAIFGTVMMVMIMTVAVMPLGVLAALYLREYARQGPMVRLVRICVNNLAGVPSIVFGVFGLGFFIYGVGGILDRAFFSEALPTPTFGTGGILWASLTLALLTLPVVIVSTEEGLAAVGQELRHGSLALGATKFETIWRVVIPSAAPGIFTGMILAIARATGEVAPLMITGVVKLAPALPMDSNSPYVHLERKFMHLGFHIYDVGFQSPNVEAAIPMVYSTTFLLLFIVVALNLTAITIRNRLRRKYATSAF